VPSEVVPARRQARAAIAGVLFSVNGEYPWKSWGTLRPENLILIPVFRSESSHQGFFAKDFVCSLDDPTDCSVRIGRANEGVRQSWLHRILRHAPVITQVTTISV